MPPKPIINYAVGDLVFAKVKGYPPWPARIESEPPFGYKAGPGRYPVFFFGTYESAVVSGRDLSPYEQNKHKLGTPRKIKNFNEGLKEIESNPSIQVNVGSESIPNEDFNEPQEDAGAQSLDEPEEEPPVEEEEVDEEEEEEEAPIEDKPVKDDSDVASEIGPPPVLTEEPPTKNSTEIEANASHQSVGSDSDDDERKLVIDDQVVSTKRKKKESTTSVKKKSKTSDKSSSGSGHTSKKKSEKGSSTSASRSNKRRRVFMNDSSDSDTDKRTEIKATTKSADTKAAAKVTSDSDNVKTKAKDSSDDKSSEEEKKSRKRKKEKSRSKPKDEKRRKKDHKTKDSEPEVVSKVTTETEEITTEEPDVEKLKIKLQDKEKEIQQKLQEKEKEKERRKQEKKEQKRKEKLEKSTKVAPPITEVLTTIDNDIKDALSVKDANVERCLEAMERLKTVPITPKGLEEYGTQLKAVIHTLKKCRKYKTDERVRQKSDHLFHKFRDFFYNSDGSELCDSLSLTTNPGADSSDEPKDESQVLSTEPKATDTEQKSPLNASETESPVPDDSVVQKADQISKNVSVNNGLSANEEPVDEDIKAKPEIKMDTVSVEVSAKTIPAENSDAQPIEKTIDSEVQNGVKSDVQTKLEKNETTTDTTPESVTNT